MAITSIGVQLGDISPNFEADTTEGRIDFHKWMGSSWCVLFSHPKNFTPVCTTELGFAARIKNEFDKRNVKLIALSLSSLEKHFAWILDINETQQTVVNYPLIADEKGTIAKLYGMIHPNVNENATARTVFVIDPEKRIRLTMSYPSSTGRNFFELLRVIDALQLHDMYKVATPVNWKPGEDCIILANLTDQELAKLVPQSYKTLKSYLRMVPHPGFIPLPPDTPQANI
jgi:alkyl hydroperoxide reductase subunit AhpC